MNTLLPSKISSKIAATFLTPIILMGGALLSLFIYNNSSWQQEDEIHHQIQLLHFLSISLKDSFIHQNHEHIQQQLSEFGKQEGINRIRMLAKDGKILFDSKGAASEGATPPSAQECFLCHQESRIEVPQSVMQISTDENTRLFRHFTPLLNHRDCQSCHAARERVLGFFLADFSPSKADQRRPLLLAQLGLSSLVALLAIVIILYITLRRMVDYPLRQITSRIRGISVVSGKLNHIEYSSRDEIGEIVTLINELAERLKHSREELASLYQVTHEIVSTLDFEKAILASTSVFQVMETEIEVIYDDMSIREVMEVLKRSQNTFFPVVNHDKMYLGVITLHEIRNVLVDQDFSPVLHARDFQRSDFPSIPAGYTLKEAADLVLNKEIASLPVVHGKDKILVGILDHTHLSRILKSELLRLVGL